MNALQSAKYALVKAQLKAMSLIGLILQAILATVNLYTRLKRLSIALMPTPTGLLYLSLAASYALLVVNNLSLLISWLNTTHKNISSSAWPRR